MRKLSDGIAVITQTAPYGIGEAFTIGEIVEFARETRVVLIPMRPSAHMPHRDGAELTRFAIRRGLIDPVILFSVLRQAFPRPVRFARAFFRILRSRSLVHLAKNLAVLPKACWIASVVQRRRLRHIHAYWASTSSTVAMLAAELSGITWSFTCYRWDIADDNLLREKVASASFARVADHQGRREILGLCGEGFERKVLMIRSGVRIPPREAGTNTEEVLRIAVPALLVEKKGHCFLLEALRMARPQLGAFRCYLYGDGPLRSEIAKQISAKRLGDVVTLCGLVDHDELISRYTRGDIDVVVLPSIVTASGEREGIPIALIEAMSAGVPVISTTTGGIPELISDGVGILVEPESAPQLVDALLFMARNPHERIAMGQRARERIAADYALERVVSRILMHINESDSR